MRPRAQPIRRTRLKPWKRPLEDRVSPELAAEVFARDQGCVAAKIEGTAEGCWGRAQIAHVKKEGRMGKRAEPQRNRLVEICDGHAEPGMKAGRVWVTAADNIAKLRAYLLEKEGE